MRSENYTYYNAPIPGGGYVTGFLFHEKFPNILYARTDIGGTYRFSYDDNKWESLICHVGMEDLSETFPIALALDDKRPERLYIACGDGREYWAPMGNKQANDKCGVLCISDDYGKSFRYERIPCYIHGNLPGRGTGLRLIKSRAAENTLYFASQRDGLGISRDDGKTWEFKPVCGEECLTLVWASDDDKIIIAGTAGVTTKDGDLRGKSLYVSYDMGVSFTPLSQPENHIVEGSRLSGYVAGRIDADDEYVYVTLSNTGKESWVVDMGYSCDSADLLGGKVIRYKINGLRLSDYEDITPQSFPKENAGKDLPYGFGGISVSRSKPGLLAAATLCKGDGDVLYVSYDSGSTWDAALYEYKRGNIHFNAPYMKREYNGDFSIIHWLSDVKINPFNEDELWFNTGTGVFKSEYFSKDERSFSDCCRGLEETVHLSLYSPPSGDIKLIDILGDLGGFAFKELNTPCENSFADDDGNRYITCLNADCPDDDPMYFVVTARGNWKGKTKGGLIRNKDKGEHFKRFNLPYGISERIDGLCKKIETPNVNVGWVAVGADKGTVVLSISDNIYLNADCVVVTHNEGESYEKVRVFDIQKNEISDIVSGSPDEKRAYHMKVFSDRVNPNLFYGFGESGQIYVSKDRGHDFYEYKPHSDKSWGSVEFGLVDCANKTEIRGNSGFEGELYIAAKEKGLWKFKYDSSVDKVFLNKLSNDTDVIYRMGLGKHDGEDGYIGYKKAIYISGILDGVYGFYRSDDEGRSWIRLNDDKHVFGEINSIEGDSRVSGRFFIGTGSLGVICGERI